MLSEIISYYFLGTCLLPVKMFTKKQRYCKSGFHKQICVSIFYSIKTIKCKYERGINNFKFKKEKYFIEAGSDTESGLLAILAMLFYAK